MVFSLSSYHVARKVSNAGLSYVSCWNDSLILISYIDSSLRLFENSAQTICNV